ncbi:MAG: class I SAM-dependent methyltransferase [Lysobacterales bacterium]
MAVRIALSLSDGPTFDLDCVLEWFKPGTELPVLSHHLRGSGLDIAWLPDASYEIAWSASALDLEPGEHHLVVSLYQSRGPSIELAHRETLPATIDTGSGGVRPQAEGTQRPGHWEVRSLDGGVPVDQLSWRRGHKDWFYRHFDHAARTIISYMLGDSPLLQGRILDVGCGDGITDLGVFYRCQPKQLIGIDPFKGYERLPEVCAANHLPLNDLPEGLKFLPASGNDIPFEDNSFDVVLSWGSLEHIAGGYMDTLKEIRRVLKNGGLLFAHPGLYYSNFGHHLGEFCDEPFFHLTKTHEELEQLVLNTQPNYMDRAGEFSTPAQYWQWYNELNPMTVAGFEGELKDLGFEFYRAALRTEDMIEYHHPKLQNYGMQDLATVELYLSAYNRK